MPIQVQVKGLDEVIARLSSLPADTDKALSAELQAFGFDVELMAKELAPADEGILRSSIVSEMIDLLRVTVFARTNYAAYLEFGTRGFAAAYVASLPADWQTYAASFQGSGGSAGDYFARIFDWVKRKGIDPKLAYPIAISILRFGIKAHPFLYPAFQANIPKLESRLRELFK